MRRLSSALVLLAFVAGCSSSDQVAPAAEVVQTVDATWSTDARVGREAMGRYAFVCPSNPPESDRDAIVWGSDPYTDDSSVCRAGVHAGAITYASGGRVVVEMQPGQEQYVGSVRHGVETEDYGSWGGSFTVVR